MSENKFDPKKFLEFKLKPHQDLLNVLKPKPAQRLSQRTREKPRSFIFELLKAFVIAFIILAVVKIFLVETAVVSSDSMEPTLSYQDILIVNKISYGIVNPFWGAAQTRRLLGIIPNPLFGHIYQLSSGRYIIRLAKDPQRFDLVAVRSPVKGQIGMMLIKRIIGLPGERIAMRNGAVLINGKKLADKRRVVMDKFNMAQIRIPYGAYFILGDNRAKSMDSRSFGPVSGNDIVGQVMVRFWPVGKPRNVK